MMASVLNDDGDTVGGVLQSSLADSHCFFHKCMINVSECGDMSVCVCVRDAIVVFRWRKMNAEKMNDMQIYLN